MIKIFIFFVCLACSTQQSVLKRDVASFLELSDLDNIDGHGIEKLLWNQNKINVCWLRDENPSSRYFTERQLKILESIKYDQDELSEDIKAGLRKKVESEFIDQRTGIHFVGWKNCDEETEEVNLVIITGKNFYYSISDGQMMKFLGRGRIGQGYLDSQGRLRKENIGYLYIDTTPPESELTRFESLQLILLHELGHVAGLYHEHIRSEAKLDPRCKLTGLETNEKIESQSRALTSYDSTSIMNYCFSNFLIKYGLSVDVEDKSKKGKYDLGKIKDSILNILGGDNLKLNIEDVKGLEDKELVKKILKTKNSYQLKFKIGLSQKDIRTLKCFYRLDKTVIPKGCESKTVD